MRTKTVPISEQSIHYHFLHNRIYTSNGNAVFKQHRDIAFQIRGIEERYAMTIGSPLYIGRFHAENLDHVGLDLTPYGADRYGVSRIHARIDMDYDHYLYITDMDSTNGTLVCGKALLPYKRTRLHDGDKLALGCLKMAIFFV